jgi:molybdopterin/thiamine biosynthesis adenylyltransferase
MSDIEKYSRQILFSQIGKDGQTRLLASRAAIVGCGAIGAACANLLARAGVGYLRIIDRDFVELSNLQRQTLFDESDALQALPKAVAAERRLCSINSGIQVEGIIADVTASNVTELLAGVDLLLDGTDNFETRFLVNDYAVQSGLPWIYAAAVASYGLTMTILPGQTPCLACLIADTALGLGAQDTCDTIGIIGPIVNLIASLEAAAALRILTGYKEQPAGQLFSFDVWSGHARTTQVVRDPQCSVCVGREFRHLSGKTQPHITMCGRDSVQIHERTRAIDLGQLEQRLKPLVSEVLQNGFLLRFQVAPYEMIIFADGRAILKGTKDPSIARSIYSRYIGA